MALKMVALITALSMVINAGYSQKVDVDDLDGLVRKLNSRWDEQNPVLHPDGKTLYFTRANDSLNVGGPRDKGDIWISQLDASGRWSQPFNAGPRVNNELYNSMLGFSPDGNIIFLNIEKKHEGGLVTVDGIGYSLLRDNEWSAPQKISVDYYLNRSKNQNGSISRDGRVLLLSMDSYASRGQEDLYVSFYSNGKWSQPVNLGSDINSSGQEMTPYLSADNQTLYFSSNGHGGKGGRDLFEASRKDESWKSWTKPNNLGEGVNTEGVELFYFIDYRNEIAYYTSTQNSDGYGDIKAVSISSAEPQKTDEVGFEELAIVQDEPVPTSEPVTSMLWHAKIVNSKDQSPVSAAVSVSWAGEERFFNTDEISGEFETELPPDAGRLTISIKSPGFMALEEDLVVPDGSEKTIFEITPLEVGTVIRLNKVYFERGKAVLLDSSFTELDRVAEVLFENPNIKIELSGHTDNQGSAKLNLELSKERVALVENYLVGKGVDASRIKGKGYGGTRPIASNASEETRQLNRRVEFRIIKN